MLLFPLAADVPMYRWPFANFIIIGVTAAFSVMVFAGAVPEREVEAMVLQWSVKGLFGYMLVHGDVLHLLGNMLFLWVFGNAVCAKVGNIPYFFIYVGTGAAAGVAHLLVAEAPAIGASGAVNGVVGMYLMLYPLNNITVFYLFIYYIGTFALSGMWLILMWLAFDLWGAWTGAPGVAYWAHLGGFAGGFLLATALLLSGVIRMSSTECSLIAYLRGET